MSSSIESTVHIQSVFTKGKVQGLAVMMAAVVASFLWTIILLSTGIAAAEAKTFRTDYITSPVGWCMIADAGGIGCHGEVLPGVTDGYLRLAQQGKPVLGDTGGSITKKPIRNTSARLRKGDRWNRRGVRCRYIPGGIMCSNGRHGFRLKRHGYRVF